MNMTATKFRRADCGCWIDGAFGMEHAAAKLRVMLMDCGEANTGLLDELEEVKPEDDDFDSIIEAATDALDAFCDPDVVWLWEAGDLLLVENENE